MRLFLIYFFRNINIIISRFILNVIFKNPMLLITTLKRILLLFTIVFSYYIYNIMDMKTLLNIIIISYSILSMILLFFNFLFKRGRISLIGKITSCGDDVQSSSL